MEGGCGRGRPKSGLRKRCTREVLPTPWAPMITNLASIEESRGVVALVDGVGGCTRGKAREAMLRRGWYLAKHTGTTCFLVYVIWAEIRLASPF